MVFTPQLFQPVQIGDVTLQHRIVLAPLTRFKATTSTHIPVVRLVKEYYSQRSSTPGSLLISEATLIAAEAGGYSDVPGIWSQEQIKAWKEVTDAVHANKSFIFLQLWALGRNANPDVLTSESSDPANPLPFTAPSAVPRANTAVFAPTSGSQAFLVPRELTKSEIVHFVHLYAQAAKNAVHEAGFDGVEVMGANSFLVEQFLRGATNKRTDEYGGSIENRSRFGLEVVDAVVKAVGEHKTAIRLSPWADIYGMDLVDTVPQYSHFVSELRTRHPNLAYLHVIEPRVVGHDDRESSQSNDFIRDIWAPRPLISAGGYTRATAVKAAEEKGDLVAFGRWYTSNPDLPRRLEENIPLTPYDRKTFYVPASAENTEVGYIDFPFAPRSLPFGAWLRVFLYWPRWLDLFKRNVRPFMALVFAHNKYT